MGFRSRRKRTRVLRALSAVSSVMLAGVAVSAVGVGAGMSVIAYYHGQGMEVREVVSESMLPVLEKGDLVVVSPEAPEVGGIGTYTKDSGDTVIHRVMLAGADYVFKGDNNASYDPVVPAERVTGSYVRTLRPSFLFRLYQGRVLSIALLISAIGYAIARGTILIVRDSRVKPRHNTVAPSGSASSTEGE